MKDSTDTPKPHKKTFIGWLFFPISLFPLAALLTYNQRAMIENQIPPEPSTNWIGPIGDNFAYYGYDFLGLTIWIVPLYCILVGCKSASGASLRPGLKFFWCTNLLISAAALVQILNVPLIESFRIEVNAKNSGGLIGFLLGEKMLLQLFGRQGSTVLLLILLLISLIGAIGINFISNIFKSLFHWALAGKNQYEVDSHSGDSHSGDIEPDSSGYDETQALIEKARQAREDALRQKEEQKRRIREEKEKEKLRREAERQEREAERRQREEERTAELRRLQESTDRNEPSITPPPPPRKEHASPHPSANSRTRESKNSNDIDGKSPYILPSADLLAPLRKSEADHSDVASMSQKLIDTLKLFGLNTTLAYTVQGPVVTKYAISPEPGTRPEKFTALQATLMMALKAKSLRIEAPIPGEDKIGIEVPNLKPAGISFREIFESEEWKSSKAELPLLFGKRADGKELVADLASMPHMLVAGATGQGKSVCLNSLICGLLMTRTPEQLKLIMVDPKSVEFTPYSSIPHLLVPVITDNRKVVFSLHWAVAEMEKRLKMFARARVRNIYDFNHRKTITQTDMFGNDAEINSDMPATVPYIVIIIDEAADLIGQCGKEVNPDIQRITQKARAAGIHIILATQRPDAKIITGTIKANIPGRVAFKTSQAIDSRTILDESGAENLIGRGDMLFRGKDGLLIRAQGAWISDSEIMNITEFIEQHSSTQFDETFASKLSRVKEAAIEDPFAANEDDPDNKPEPVENKATKRELVKAAANADDFKKAVECVINTKRASVSHFQRQMGWGYNHAAKILDMLTDRGIVSPPQGMGPRQITMDEDQLIGILNGGNAVEDADSDAKDNENTTTDITDGFTEEQP